MQFFNRYFIVSTIILIFFLISNIIAIEADAPIAETKDVWQKITYSDDKYLMDLTEDLNDRSLISKMIERGKILMKSLPKTGIKIAGNVLKFVPTPETIFNVGKQALIGLPQELIAYAVNSVCKCQI